MTLITSNCGETRFLSIKWPESPRFVCPSGSGGLVGGGIIRRGGRGVRWIRPASRRPVRQARRPRAAAATVPHSMDYPPKYDPNHLELRCNALPEHQMARITSVCVPFRYWHFQQSDWMIPHAAVLRFQQSGSKRMQLQESTASSVDGGGGGVGVGGSFSGSIDNAGGAGAKPGVATDAASDGCGCGGGGLGVVAAVPLQPGSLIFFDSLLPHGTPPNLAGGVHGRTLRRLLFYVLQHRFGVGVRRRRERLLLDTVSSSSRCHRRRRADVAGGCQLPAPALAPLPRQLRRPLTHTTLIHDNPLKTPDD